MKKQKRNWTNDEYIVTILNNMEHTSSIEESGNNLKQPPFGASPERGFEIDMPVGGILPPFNIDIESIVPGKPNQDKPENDVPGPSIWRVPNLPDKDPNKDLPN